MHDFEKSKNENTNEETDQVSKQQQSQQEAKRDESALSDNNNDNNNNNNNNKNRDETTPEETEETDNAAAMTSQDTTAAAADATSPKATTQQSAETTTDEAATTVTKDEANEEASQPENVVKTEKAEVETDGDGDAVMKDESPPEPSQETKETSEAASPNEDAMDVDDKPAETTAKADDGDADTKSEEKEPVSSAPAPASTSAPPEASPAKEQNEVKAEPDTTASTLQSNEEKDKPLVQANGEAKESAPSTKTNSNGSSSTTPAPAPASSNTPTPLMKGTLSYDLNERKHLIRGMWNFENSTEYGSQRFELMRKLPASVSDAELMKLPQNGEFHGSFSLAYKHVTSKGKQKERTKVISESGVNLVFTPTDEDDSGRKSYSVKGTGTNQFGVFDIYGKVTPSKMEDDPTLHVELRKRYQQVPPGEGGAAATTANAAPANEGELPPPSKSFPTGVVCLRGKLAVEESNDLGVTSVIHRINGMWAGGLDILLADPENTRRQANRFEYEHKSSSSGARFPVSGKYTGWFDVVGENGSLSRVNENALTFRFRKNNAGYYNIEGKGQNCFGNYSVSGTLTRDNTITIFRIFQLRKLKGKSTTDASGTGVGSAPSGGAARRPSLAPAFEPTLKLEDVEVPPEADNGGTLEPMTPPMHQTYSAVSRGILKVNDDGSHGCQGKWAVTREHMTNGQHSNFNFRLEPQYVQQEGDGSQFPVDSAMYKGSFQLKKQGSRYQTIVDQQVVMKFRMNSQGSYNVYGKGINAIGEFNLVGTLIIVGKASGNIELYRMYPPEKMAQQPIPKAPTSMGTSGAGGRDKAKSMGGSGPLSSGLPGPPPPKLQRRESTRLVKLPSKLEDDDPSALLSRSMSKCAQILRLVREKDVELGAFFSVPVDPVALGIPTYHQIIKEPMDLRTIHRRMEAGDISSPDEFARLMRLVFENAITFNVDPTHSVHQAARTLLVMFNLKYRDVERMVQSIRRAADDDSKGKKRGKDDKKRRGDPPMSLKARRLEEVQAMAAANSNAFSSIVASAPSSAANAPVSRTEFNLLLNMVQQLSRQLVETHTAVAELSSGDIEAPGPVGSSSLPRSASTARSTQGAASSVTSAASDRKKPVKRKSEAITPEPVVIVDESAPLSLEEQELLTETINELPPEHLGGIIQIIREAAPVGADEDEIDLEIDQLDTKTQRKLLRHVSKVSKDTAIDYNGADLYSLSNAFSFFAPLVVRQEIEAKG